MMGLRVQLSPIPPLSAKPRINPKPKPRNAFTPLRPLSPTVLSSSTSAVAGDAGLRFREKLLYLEHDLGVDTSKALSLNPALRAAPLSYLRSVADFLAFFGLRPTDSGRIFSMYPHLLTSDPAADLRPVFDFLLGPAAIPSFDIRKAVVRCPRLLVSSVPNQLLPTLYFLRRLGFIGKHRITCQTTVLLVSSVEATLIPKLDYLQSLGFSYWETKKMVLRSAGLLTFSIENNFRPKVEFLVGEMGRELSELKEFPQYFSFSLERKIKPRYRMLVDNGFSMPLPEMLKVSDGEFRQRLLEMRLRPVGEKL